MTRKRSCCLTTASILTSATSLTRPRSPENGSALILAAAGGDRPETPVLDGIDPLPELGGKTRPAPRSFFWEFRGMHAVRRGQFKWIQPKAQSRAELYDLNGDLSETQDLAADQQAIAAELQQEFTVWRSQFP